MRILCFVDMHASAKAFKIIKEKAENADLIICAGDFSVWGNAQEAILRQFNAFKKPFILIPGNHESDAELKSFCKEFKNIHYAHKRLLKIGDFLVIGYGGGGFTEREKEFEDFVEDVKDELENKKIILVTHAPPYGTEVDKINSGHRGCRSFSKFIEKYEPLLHVCGHLHETGGKKQLYKNTLILNPGRVGRFVVLKQKE
ncbi:metallophosphoesterase [Candidatus Woesearchaeota archaeon]|nr:metallophosphoesterase [Candidatus Woesearchaeota archaeon]